jgi:hypothetical protein
MTVVLSLSPAAETTPTRPEQQRDEEPGDADDEQDRAAVTEGGELTGFARIIAASLYLGLDTRGLDGA